MSRREVGTELLSHPDQDLAKPGRVWAKGNQIVMQFPIVLNAVSSWYIHLTAFNHLLLFSSVPFSRSVKPDSLRPHESQHARPPCPSPTPRVHPNPCPLSRWCHPTISSSVIPFSFHPQSFSASGSFPMSQLFAWGSQSIGVSASTSFLPLNTQDLSPLGWIGWIFLKSRGLSRVFSNTTVQKHQWFSAQLSYSPTLTSIPDYWKNHSFH